jgi:hypothetical protein
MKVKKSGEQRYITTNWAQCQALEVRVGWRTLPQRGCSGLQALWLSLWKQWSGYHRRSLVETTMRCFKRLGERVMARAFARQVVELHVRVALLNRFTQLGCPVTVPVA